MFLMIDNYDSFVYNLLRYFKELNQEIQIYKNDKVTIEEIKEIKPKGIIISPGPKSPNEASICIDIINEFKGKIPILGICLGHQCIGQAFGAKIIKGPKPIHGKVSTISNDGKGVFKDIPQKIKVTRYHSLIIDSANIGNDLEISAITQDDIIMGIRHKYFDVEGVQFHPEAELTEYGHKILENFIERCL